ncbi:hypothetical protein CR513_26682, partial [Mucuna pruriens]
MDRSMIDAASGGALMDKTPVAARHLISNMASNRFVPYLARNRVGPNKKCWSRRRIPVREAAQQRTPTQGNSPSLEDLMKQLVTSNLEFQQLVSSSNIQFQQNMIATI